METSMDNIMSRNNTTVAQKNMSGTQEKNLGAPKSSAKTCRENAVLITVFALAFCFCLLSTAGAASVQNRRAIASAAENITSPAKICHQNTPCGWAIYVPFTRRIDYFMKNTCECHSSLACLKTDDDLSVNAYVYRCKTRPAVTTTDLPTAV